MIFVFLHEKIKRSFSKWLNDLIIIDQYALILRNGIADWLRLIGLTWDAIDFNKNDTLTVNKTLEYQTWTEHFWRAGPPKTQNSYRTIPFDGYKLMTILKTIL